LSSSNTVPEPIIIQTADLVESATVEQYEGCLVEVHDVVVTKEQINYGQWYVADVSATPCQVDDGFFYLDSVTPPIVITLGMEWAVVRGCLDFSYNEYGINPRTPDDLIEPGRLNANFTADPLTGIAPLQFQFTDASSGNITNWEWDFQNDGIIDSYIQNPLHIYSETGVYTVSLTITDGTNEDTEINDDYIEVTETGTEHKIIPVETKLYQNHPNPFNPVTTIQFDIKENESGVLSIFNVKGQIVVSQSFNSGRHNYLWNAQNCSSGVYSYKLQTESIIETKKMLLLK